ncbi:MAG TPA: LamG-like jellyroll fold domain-containing protein [Pyrinomonadaceae bacterium]
MQHNSIQVTNAKTHRNLIILALIFGGTLFALLLNFTSAAQTQKLFTDNFEDGDSNGWTKSGGTWSVVADGSQVFKQSGLSSDARSLAGSPSWTDYAVEARIKPLQFNGSNRFVALIARAQSNTSYYYLALRSNNTLELKKLVSGSSTTLATKSFPVTTQSWYSVKLEVAGTSLKAYVNGTLQLSATDSQFRAGNIGGATYYASAEFDDFAVTSVSTTTPTPTATPTASPTATPTPTASPTPTVTPTPVPTPSAGPVGFASVNALGQNGTSGGAGGATVTVTTATQFLDYIRRAEPYVIRVDGLLTLPAAMHNIASNKTIVGVGNYSGISGAGLQVTNASKNIIVRNMIFTNAPDDSFNVQNSSHHIWIDHCTFTNGYDGLLDIKRGSDFVTVSWNRFLNHGKTMLLGHSDSNGAEDIGHLRVTYHHNWFDGTATRHPRVRFGESVHVYNNYYYGNEYGVASTMNAGVVVEGNYFENVDNPTYTFYGDSDEPGRLIERNNFFVNSGPVETRGTVTEPGTYYNYTLDPAQNVKQIVTQGAGVGHLQFLLSNE